MWHYFAVVDFVILRILGPGWLRVRHTFFCNTLPRSLSFLVVTISSYSLVCCFVNHRPMPCKVESPYLSSLFASMCKTRLSKSNPSHSSPLKVRPPSSSSSHWIDYAEVSDQALVGYHRPASQEFGLACPFEQRLSRNKSSCWHPILPYYQSPTPTRQTRGAAHPEPEKRPPTHRYLCKLQCPFRLPAHPSPPASTLLPQPQPTLLVQRHLWELVSFPQLLDQRAHLIKALVVFVVLTRRVVER